MELTNNHFLLKAKVLTDGLGLIGLIYKLSEHNFSFSLKSENAVGDRVNS